MSERGSRVFWNGAVVPAEEARVSVLDTGYLYGDGVYDTMRAYKGRVFAQDRHLARLAKSAARVGLPAPDAALLTRGLGATLEANSLTDAVLRITMTRGRLARRLDLSSAGSPSIAITADPLVAGADDARRIGSSVAISRYVRTALHPLAGVKSTSYQVSLLARDEARRLGHLEVLLANETGEICEGAAANVFIVQGETLVTPPANSGILAGVTREVAIECARVRGLGVLESTIDPLRLLAADEVFMTGTTIQIAAITKVGEHRIGEGRPGPVTGRLLSDYLDRVRKDTEA